MGPGGTTVPSPFLPPRWDDDDDDNVKYLRVRFSEDD